MGVDRLRNVFDSISRCPNVAACYNSDVANPCRAIVNYQKRQWNTTTYDRFQVPEPWVGQIDKARILFVASNPSISDDDHALGGSDDDAIWESHHLAFGGHVRIMERTLHESRARSDPFPEVSINTASVSKIGVTVCHYLTRLLIHGHTILMVPRSHRLRGAG
jgi:hypothetical protein